MEECRKIDNKPFFVDEDHWLLNAFNEDNTGHLKFREALRASDENDLADNLDYVLEIPELVLGRRGRGNQLIQAFTNEDKDECCWITQYTFSRNGRSDGIILFRVEKIFAVLVHNEAKHVCFFGSRWRGRRVKGLFDVHEIRGIDDRMTTGALPIGRAGFAAKVVHKHRFNREKGHTVWENMTVTCANAHLKDSCRFEIECYRHEKNENQLCEICIEELLKQTSDPGTEAFVRLGWVATFLRTCAV